MVGRAKGMESVHIDVLAFEIGGGVQAVFYLNVNTSDLVVYSVEREEARGLVKD